MLTHDMPESRADSGTITFLFTDIEGSTALLKRLGRGYAELLSRHHTLVREAVQASNGRVLDTAGDGFFIAFARAHDAVVAAVEIQRRMAETAWPDGVPVRVRMGLHTGEPALTQEGYVGISVHLAARISSAARGGQILLSRATLELIEDDLPPGLEVRDLGLHSFKDIDGAEQLYELVIDGVASPWPRPHPVRLAYRYGLIAVPVLLLAAFVLFWRGRDRVIPYVPPSDPATGIAVFPFAVHGADQLADLGEGMMHLLSINLDGAADLRRIDPHALRAELSRGRALAAPDLERALEVAQKFGARLFILGNITAVGGGEVTAVVELYDVAAPASPTPVKAQGRSDQFNELVDDLTVGLLETRLGGTGQSVARIALRTSDSLSATRAFLEGEQHFGSARYDRAVASYQRATEIDPSFALAHYRLSMAAEWNVDFQLVSISAEQALHNAEGLSSHDFKLIEAWHDLVSGRAAQAQRQYREVTEVRPEDVEAWYGLAETLVHFNPVRGLPKREARRAFEKVLQLAPDYGDARFHLLELAAADHDLPAFDSLLVHVDAASDQWLAWQAVRAFEWGSEVDRSDMVRRLRGASRKTVGTAVVRVAAHLRDFDGARRLAGILDEQAGSDNEWHAAAHIVIAELDFASGRYRAAMDGLSAAVNLEPMWSLEMLGLIALPDFVAASPDEMAAIRDRLSRLNFRERSPSTSFFFGVHAFSHPVIREYLVGMLSIRLHDLERANVSLAALERIQAPEAASLKFALAQSLRAHLDRARGRRDEALQRLQGIELNATIEQVGFSPFYSRPYDRFVIGELLFEAGRDSAALPWYSSLTEGYDILFTAPAHFRLSQLYERLGDTDRATLHSQRFRMLWRGAREVLEPGNGSRW